MSIKFPKWVDELPEDQRRQGKLRFLLKLAALYATREGSLAELSVKCGMQRQTLGIYSTNRDEITAELAVKIEQSCVGQIVHREHLRPDLFEGAS